MTKILITGGTGLIGKHLNQKLEKLGYKVAVLSRNPKKSNQYKWDIAEEYIDEEALKNTDYIIHLAGAGIADKRWSVSRKKELINSRVQSASLLFKKVQEYNIALKGFISASGIGYYGAVTSETIFTEKEKPENDFISKICIQWEKAARKFEELNIPVTILRTGVVLSKNGGALEKMNTPLFLSALGSGKQYMPWIHIEDLVNLYIEAIENPKFTGVYNAVAPDHQTNQSFTKILGKTIKKPVLPMNAPSFVLKTALGELAYVLLKGSRVSADKVVKKHTFIFPNIQVALKDIYHR